MKVQGDAQSYQVMREPSIQICSDSQFFALLLHQRLGCSGEVSSQKQKRNNLNILVFYELVIPQTYDSPFNEEARKLGLLNNSTAPSRCAHLKLTLVILSEKRSLLLGYLTSCVTSSQPHHLPWLSPYSGEMTRSFYSESGRTVYRNFSEALFVALISVWG